MSKHLNPSFDLIPVKFSKKEKLEIVKKQELFMEILMNKPKIKGMGCVSECWRKFKNCTAELDRYERGSDEWINIADKCYLKVGSCLSKCKTGGGSEEPEGAPV